jgi:hypothetical protein
MAKLLPASGSLEMTTIMSRISAGEGRNMQRSIVALALSGVVLTACAMPSAAQQNGIVIQNNGVDSVDSAAGADSVRVSNNPGNGQAVSAAGANNEIATGGRARDRKDRSARNSAEAPPAEEYVAPAEEYVAPAEGEYQAYTDAGEYVEPVAAPEPIVAPEQTAVDTSTQQLQVLKLPSTGVGDASALPFAAAASGLVAFALGTIGLKRRQFS